MELNDTCVNDIKYELKRLQGFEQMYYNQVEECDDLHSQIADLKSLNDKYKNKIDELNHQIYILKDIIIEHEVYMHGKTDYTK